MNQDKAQNLFIALLAAGLLVMGTGIYVISQQVQMLSMSMQKIQQGMISSGKVSADSAEGKCVNSGGSYSGSVCTCGRDYFIQNGMCMGQDGMTQRELEEVKAGQERLMKANGSTDASSIVHGDFSLQLPLNMDFQKIADGKWNIISDASKKIGELTCPPPETGYEAWDFTESSKTYVHGGKTLHARKLVGKALPGAGDIGGIAIIYAGMTDPETHNPNSCQILLDLATPATAEQRDWIDTLYGLIY